VNVTLLIVSFGRAIKTLLDEVRRTPTWLVGMMLAVVICGTILAQLLR
jgi:hypothetical protein